MLVLVFFTIHYVLCICIKFYRKKKKKKGGGGGGGGSGNETSFLSDQGISTQVQPRRSPKSSFLVPGLN